MQILWINILMDGPPAQSLGLEPSRTKNAKRNRSKNLTDSFLDDRLMKLVFFSAFFMALGTLFVFKISMARSHSIIKSQTMAFTTFVFMDMMNAFISRSSSISAFKIGIRSNPSFLYSVGGCLLVQILMTQISYFHNILQTETLSFSDFGLIILVSSVLLLADELRKARVLKPWLK